MQIAIIGLGRMGFNIALHLLEQGVDLVVWNRTREKSQELKIQISNVKPNPKSKFQIGNVIIAESIVDIPQKLTDEPRVVFLYVPAGAVTDQIIGELSTVVPRGSIIIDGGNSFFKDSQRRFAELQKKGLHFLDMGTSGGLQGARTGACLMVGGEKEIYEQVKPILEKIACKDGYGYFGPSGAGHFVKMIHNAVEYGMMGAIAEGLGVISNFPASPSSSAGKPAGRKFQISNEKGESAKFQFDLAKVTRVWAHGSIVSGLLMDSASSALAKNPTLSDIEGVVPRGETEAEMEWLAQTGIPNPVIQQSRLQRVETRTRPSFIGKVVAALRREFGGHGVKNSS